jgi:hypothetical protein
LLGGVWTADELTDAQRLWVEYRGWAKVLPVTDRSGCVEYAAKHLLKQGAADNFEFMVGRDYGSATEQRFARRARAHSGNTGSSDAERRSAGAFRIGCGSTVSTDAVSDSEAVRGHLPLLAGSEGSTGV